MKKFNHGETEGTEKRKKFNHGAAEAQRARRSRCSAVPLSWNRPGLAAEQRDRLAGMDTEVGSPLRGDLSTVFLQSGEPASSLVCETEPVTLERA